MITVDPADPTAPFEQVRSQIADQIQAGSLTADQRLPSIRQLAADLRVAPGTVAKAYQLLEADGLIETSRARGTHVVGGRAHPAAVRRAAERYVAEVGGLSLAEALGAVRSAWPAARG